MNTKTKIILGLAVILVLGAISVHVVKADSFCYPSNSNCITVTQGTHSVTNYAGEYWASQTIQKPPCTPVSGRVGYSGGSHDFSSVGLFL